MRSRSIYFGGLGASQTKTRKKTLIRYEKTPQPLFAHLISVFESPRFRCPHEYDRASH